MKKLSILIFVLALFVAISGCSVKNNISESPTPPVNSSPADTADQFPSEVPDETQLVDENENNEIYTKVIQLEGTDETVKYMLIKGSYDYTMPLDVDRFEFKKVDNADYYQSTANENVYIAVSYIKNTTIAEETQSLSVDTNIVSSDEKATKVGDYDATNLHVVYGSNPDSKVINHYLIEDDGGVYIISCVYFLEAAEGFGARMFYMTQDFKIE